VAACWTAFKKLAASARSRRWTGARSATGVVPWSPAGAIQDLTEAGYHQQVSHPALHLAWLMPSRQLCRSGIRKSLRVVSLIPCHILAM